MIELDIEFMGKKYPKRKFTIDDRSQKGTPLLMRCAFHERVWYNCRPRKNVY